MLRHFLVVFGLLMLAIAPALAAAPVFATPKAVLDYAYAPYKTGKFLDDNGVLYSKALNDLFAKANANTPDDDVGPIDFDVFTNAQDYQLTDLTFGDPATDAAGVKIAVTFKNFGEAQSLLFHLVKEGDGWKINDIDCLTPGQTWTLSALLTAPPDTGDGSSSDTTSGDGTSN
jgi:hypothetical protein